VQVIRHIRTILDLSGEAGPSQVDESSVETASNSEADESLTSVLSHPSGEAAAAPNLYHPADVLAPPKEALFGTRAWPDDALGYIPFIANRPRESATRLSPRTFAMLTIGSRGDVQPYIALALRLKKDGHTIVIITHNEFKGWIEGYGLIHRQAGGDPTALMKLSQEHAVSQSFP
jgi:sterol 3beta-glucosyltransferase